MLERFDKKRAQYFSFFLVALSAFFLSKGAIAENYVTTVDVVKEIEKSLLFDKGTSQELNVYKSKDIKRKSNIVINHNDGEEKDYKNSEINIVVLDTKTGNNEAREKEKMAYNAALVGQYEVAVELYKQVIKAEPDNLYSKFSLAVVYQKLGQNRQAKTLYYELLKSDSENKDEIIGNLLAILIEESPKDAVYLLSRLSMENPKSCYVLAQSAIAYDKEKNYTQAIDLLKKAITCDPTRLDYKYNLAVFYDKAEDYENAYYFYSEVIKKTDGSDPSIPLDKIKKRQEFIRNK